MNILISNKYKQNPTTIIIFFIKKNNKISIKLQNLTMIQYCSF